MDDFVIDRLAWYLNKGIHHDPRLRFRALLDFLYKNNLLQKEFDFPKDFIPDDFEMRSSQLTEEGLQLFKNVYQKWLKSIDKGKSETNVSMLEKELQKIRTQQF